MTGADQLSPAQPSAHEPGEAYDGPATITLDEGRVETGVRLRGHVDPIDGRFHWYGRIDADPAIDAIGNGGRVIVTTTHGTAEGRLSDVDPWGRFRVSGTGRPPF